MEYHMSKILAAAVVALCLTGAAISAPTAAKKAAAAATPLCADDVCLKLRQAVNIAMDTAKLEVIVTGDEERRQIIPSAQAEMIRKVKAHRDEVRPLYTTALASVKRSDKATAALKEFMIVWNAAIDSFPMSLVQSRAEQADAYAKYTQRLNDAWARLALEADP
jgi:hypothetical protein